MPAALVVAVVVAVVVVVAVLAVVVVAVLAVLTVVVVVVVVVVVAAAVLIRWSSLKLPSSSAKSKLRFDPRARQILTDDDYETTAMLDSPSATLVSTPPDPVSSAFGLIVNLKTAEVYSVRIISLITCLPRGRGMKLWGWRTVVMVTEHTPRYPLISESGDWMIFNKSRQVKSYKF
ncbi:uncharacterized protein LOC105248144 isoform X4 [Camponotus floridanus]|uniref:uncharacterized protein LOC105248144 isoform X4 n=2 Tax=Camponotus floridanus TaxID=104421 RepID=UPI000DC6C4C3|nr:uncharacterized protein LOC105248144 isoform X4 [Camponotus floridanus]